MNPTLQDYTREVSCYLRGQKADETVLRHVEELHGIPEQGADEFRHNFAAEAKLIGQPEITKDDYLRELKVYLDTRNFFDIRPNERILRYVENKLHEIPEQHVYDFRRNFAVECYLYGEQTAFKNLLPNLPK